MNKSVHYAENLIKKECADCRIEILKPVKYDLFV